jgi:gag-polypeptide of LTR copia-type/Zinc knuckle
MSEAKKANSSVESIKTIPFGGTDTTKGGVVPSEFFRKAEVFAATKGFDEALLKEIVQASWAKSKDLTDAQKDALKMDKQAQNFMLLSCHGDAYKIIESLETAFEMFQALKNRYDSKKIKDLVKVTAKLEKCYMKSDLEDPYLWIIEMERLNRELEKCEGGTKRSDMQMKATILAKLPKRRYESVITSMNGKMGNEDFTYQDFIAEIIDHYELFVEPFKNKLNRENSENNRDGKGKHLALTTTSGKGGWRQFKGKCNKCGKQGHKARDCDQSNNNNNSGKQENAKSKVKCFKCQGFGHIAKDCPRNGESGMFVGMTHHGHGNWEECKLKSLAGTDSTEGYSDTDKLAMSILNGVAENLKRKRELNNAIHTFMWKPKQDKKAKTLIRRAKEDLNKMSWADMCETSDEEEDEEEDTPFYEEMSEVKISGDSTKEESDEDKTECDEIKEDDPGMTVDVEEVESTGDDKSETKEAEYRMDKPRTGAEWFWDEHVFMTSHVHQFDENGKESWLLDSGATTHVATITRGMTNLKTAINGEHVRVGNNETLKATAIGDLLLEQEGTKKKLLLEQVMVVPAFARNLISVGRLVERGNEFVSTKAGSSISKETGERLEFETGNDGMAYLFAQRVKEVNQVYATKEIVEIGQETKEKQRKQSMDINEAHRKFGHATEKVVRTILQGLNITPIGKMSVCDGCARAKATQKRTNKVTTVAANNPGERLYMDTSGPYTETVAGSRYWFKFVDDKTRKSWDFYGARKNLITKVLRDILDKLKAAGKPVKFIRCDNAGEHMSDLRKICDAEYNIELEYTAPHTPQHNGVVERMFARDARRALAMMIAAAWTKELQGKLWAEATKTAALLGNILPNTRSTVPPDEQFYGKQSELYNHLIEFGRVGYVTNRIPMKGKFKEKATAMVMIGYAEHHARDVYRMYNPVQGD